MRNYGTLVSLCLIASAAGTAATGVWATPHDSYSSSVGVLGCKINTNRVAYWPGSVDCDNICVKLSYEGRSVHLLRIDQSGGAYDISYDAWTYLQTGESATADPITGGTVAMEYEEVDASECADLIHTDGNKLPLSASNSMNYLTSCLSQPDSWVAKNHVLYNICDAICSLGYDEECTLDLATSNQPSCPHTLGLTSKLTSAPVYNIKYESGETVDAGTGEVVTDVDSGSGSDDTSGSDGGSDSQAVTTTASPTATPGVFFEVSTTQTPTTESSAPVSTEAPATQYPTAASSSEEPTVVETTTPTSTTPAPTTVAVSTTLISSQASSSITQIVVNSTGTAAPTTFALVTASGRPTTTSSSPSSSTTVEVTNAGHAKTAAFPLVLAASFIPFLVLGLF